MPSSQVGQLGSWAALLGLGVLTITGCAADSEREGALSAAITQPLDQPLDPLLPPEPTIPAAGPGAPPAAPRAVRATGDVRPDGLPIYDPSALDTAAIQARIEACAASLAAGETGSVRLRVHPSHPPRVAFVSGPLFLRAGVTLWIDSGVTLFAAQDPRLYDARGAGSCGTAAQNNSNGCLSLINVNGASASALLADAGVMGDGVIDGLGGEPMIGGFNGNPNGTWWDVDHA